MTDSNATTWDVGNIVDVDTAVRRIENVMHQIPYGGTYFHWRSDTIAGKKPTIVERLGVIEKNLASLAKGLAGTAAQHDERDRELMRYRQLAYAARDILKLLDGGQ